MNDNQSLNSFRPGTDRQHRPSHIWSNSKRSLNEEQDI